MLTIIIRGAHDTGKSTVANLFKMFLDENGFTDVKVVDIEPLPADQKPRFWDRFQRNQNRPVRIRVELDQGVGVTRVELDQGIGVTGPQTEAYTNHAGVVRALDDEREQCALMPSVILGEVISENNASTSLMPEARSQVAVAIMRELATRITNAIRARKGK